MTVWGDVVARARGLSSQLITIPQLRALCLAPDLVAFTATLSSMGWSPSMRAERSADPRAIETAIRRRAGARLRVLARWAGDRQPLLAPLFDDEDRRSLRAIVRGAVAGVAPEARLEGLIATPALPLRALDELARARDVSAISALLLVWRHPFAAALATEARRQNPDLFRLEVAVARAFAETARTAMQRADAPMRQFVARVIDLENLWTALTLAGGASDVPSGEVFVPGGRVVSAGDLELAARSQSAAVVASELRPRATGSPIAAALKAPDREREDRALDALIAEFRGLALRDPLSTAPIVWFVLRQRREVRALLHIVWGMALGAPRAAIEAAAGVAA